MKEILLTNDDGYESEALRKLAKMLKKEFKVRIIIVAPASEKSACSHAITLTRPLYFVKVGEDFYKLEDGTPADCVYLALAKFYKKRLPDLIISGINKGANVGEDITYSGTCAGAMEAVLQGIPALALSHYFEKSPSEIDYKNALKITRDLVERIFREGFPLAKKEFLNVNFPDSKAKFQGLKVCKAGKRLYNFKAHCATNPRGVEYFWLPSTNLAHEEDENSDITLLKQGFATLTPIMLDLTAYKQMKNLKKWLKG